MKKICTLLAVSTLCVAPVTAQTVSDDFNDNSRDPLIWEDPFIEEGSGELLEQNERVEFTAPGGFGGTDVSQAFKQYPTYNQAWQVQMVASMSPNNFSGVGEVGAVSIDIGAGNHWLGMGYGAGVLSPGPAATALAAGWSVGAGEDSNITPVALPSAIGIRIAYDPQRRLIRAYYDLDADMTDGEWTLYESFTIDGSTFGDAVVLDWGMTEFDNFYMAVDGFTSGPAIAAGSAWADDFEFTLGRTFPTPTIADNFNDNSRDPLIWEDPITDGGGEQLLETGQRLEYTAPAAVQSWASQQVKAYPSYDQAWQAQMLISMDESQFGANQLGYVGLELGGSSPGDKNLDIGRAAGNAPDLGVFPFGEVIFSGGYDPVLTEDNGYLNLLTDVDLPPVIGVRVTYDPNTRIVRTYYDLNGDNNDGEWTLFQAYTIDDSTVAGTQKLNWGMTGSDSFYLAVYGGSEGNITVASGTAWMDDFAYNAGSTAQAAAPLSFSDDFNDDSVDPAWAVQAPGFGTPVLTEANHRTEFIVSNGTGESEISQMLSQSFWPQNSQAFDLRMEVHSLPAAAMGSEGQLGVVELRVGKDSGGEDIVFSTGAANLRGSKEQVYAFSNSEVVPPGGAPADVIVYGALSEIVGVRIVWEPDTQTMSCYVDTDGDRSVESWVLAVDYTLDGVDRGTAHTSDWSMAATDQFQIELNGYADGVVINSGEAYFDNFAFVSAPLLTGYDAWASGIPDEGMRGQTDDASGNGIPNLLQYMYGLEPLAADTDVKLRIQMEGGFPVVYHGVNETAPDYFIWYQLKNSLSAPWVSAVGDEATMETVQVNGKTLRKLTFPTSPINNFIQLEVLPQM